MTMTSRFASLALIAATTMVSGCSDDDPTPGPGPDDNTLLAPPPAGEGIQFQMVTELPGGTEAEHCMFVTVPSEGLVINRDEVRYTEGSHHFLVYETTYDTIPSENDFGEAVDTSGVFDCTEGATDGWDVKRLIGGSQNAIGSSIVLFPDDVAITVPGGTVLLLNAHYINASSEAIEPEVNINFWTIPEEQKAHEGDILFLYNVFIKAPSMASSRAHMRCPVYDDITLMNAQSHMHARGVGYTAQLMGNDPFYTNAKWEDVPVEAFEGGMDISAGSTLEYWCDYENPAADTVYQGAKSTDEMCMLIGSFYPASPATANCAYDPARPEETGSIGAEWVGFGTATCAETLDCVTNALGEDDPFTLWQACINDASPDVSAEVSAAMGCFLSEGNPAACQSELDTCAAM